MKLTIHFVRHGESKANVIQRYFGILHVCIQDPSLTEKGMNDTVCNYVPECDIVCCSPLLRAKQTARLKFPNKQIYVLPNIKELGYGLDNVPKVCDSQFDNFNELSNFIHVKSKMDDPEDLCEYLSQKFVKKKGRDTTIVLFTHKRLIEKYTNVKNSKNNEIVTKVYDII